MDTNDQNNLSPYVGLACMSGNIHLCGKENKFIFNFQARIVQGLSD